MIRHRDSLVVFLSPSQRDLACLRELLESFAGASRLITNVDKCQASPILCSAEETTANQAAFPYQITFFPCKYLGVPLSIQSLRHCDEPLLIDARIPTWKSGLLTCAGRVLLTKVILSMIPIHVSIATCLSNRAVRQIDKRRRAFLWVDTEVTTVPWRTVCSPLLHFRLSVIDLGLFGFALHLRWEWLKCAEPDRG